MTNFAGARALTPEERATLADFPDEPAGKDVVRTLPATTSRTFGVWGKQADGRWGEGPATEHFFTSGMVVVETQEGGYYAAYIHKGTDAASPEESQAKATKLALKHCAESRLFHQRMDQWGRVIEARAATNRRQGLDGWRLNHDRKPMVGEVVKVWGFGGYRQAIVVDTTKGRGIVAGYATPASPRDVHFSKTTKYAQHPTMTPLSQPI